MGLTEEEEKEYERLRSILSTPKQPNKNYQRGIIISSYGYRGEKEETPQQPNKNSSYGYRVEKEERNELTEEEEREYARLRSIRSSQKQATYRRDYISNHKFATDFSKNNKNITDNSDSDIIRISNGNGNGNSNSNSNSNNNKNSYGFATDLINNNSNSNNYHRTSAGNNNITSYGFATDLNKSKSNDNSNRTSAGNNNKTSYGFATNSNNRTTAGNNININRTSYEFFTDLISNSNSNDSNNRTGTGIHDKEEKIELQKISEATKATTKTSTSTPPQFAVTDVTTNTNVRGISFIKTPEVRHLNTNIDITSSECGNDDDDDGHCKTDRIGGGTYPADTYSFLSLHGPIDHPIFFSFGLVVWLFQIIFLILLVVKVMHRKNSTSEEIGNPGEDWLAIFIPNNVNVLTRATQVMAILSYCVFADASLMDTVTAVDTFPKFDRIQQEDKVRLMMFSCILRFIQGMLAILTVLLLCIHTEDAIDIILNFTAINFISQFDDVAFGLAKWGKYGPSLEAEAKRIESLPLPRCMYRENKYKRYALTVIPITFILISCLIAIAVCQDSWYKWYTQNVRVQFRDSTNLNSYSGCFSMKNNINKATRHDKWPQYESFKENTDEGKIGYCRAEREWIIFKGDYIDACEIPSKDKLAYSEKTYSFDISTSFQDPWFSRSGMPLDVFFYESVNIDACSSFLGDGKCDDYFNKLGYGYDAGDCCATTCKGPKCGRGMIETAFETDVNSGDGYPSCINPRMKPITILLNNVYLPEETTGVYSTPDTGSDILDDLEPKMPLLTLDCDGSNELSTNILTVQINATMENKAETVMVEDGAKCIIMINNRNAGVKPILFVNFTVYHGDKASIESDPIVIVRGDSYKERDTEFQRIGECYFTKLSDHVDNQTIYTSNDPQNQAINWLMGEFKGSCDRSFFIERYALSVINFAAPVEDTKTYPNGLWINRERRCVWTNVFCESDDGSVIGLDLGPHQLSTMILKGIIATEIGLLQNLRRIDMSSNKLNGTIPDIGQWGDNMKHILFDNNYLTGSIPSSIGRVSTLKWLSFSNNTITGSIPSEIGNMTRLITLVIADNDISGSIPSEIGSASSLKSLRIGGNDISGTIPSEIGELSLMSYMDLGDNDLSGTIPSELGQLKALKDLIISNNTLTGSIPWEFFQVHYMNFKFYGTPLSNLKEIDGKIICPVQLGQVVGEHYCDCSLDCIVYPEGCDCEEAQDCCTEYKAKYTECILCEESSLDNPDLFIEDWGNTCIEAAEHVKLHLEQFGTANQCEKARLGAEQQGCLCQHLGDTPTQIASDSDETILTDDDIVIDLIDNDDTMVLDLLGVWNETTDLP